MNNKSSVTPTSDATKIPRATGTDTSHIRSNINIFRTLPFDIIDQIIGGLPFDTIIALLATKDPHVTQCIRHSSHYRRAFRAIKRDEDVGGIADVITFAYEVSLYRQPLVWERRMGLCRENPRRSCRQKPYCDYSVRGAGWDRDKLYRGTGLPPVEVRCLRDTVKTESSPGYTSTSGTFEELRHYQFLGLDKRRLEDRILKRVVSIAGIEKASGSFGFEKACTELVYALNALPVLPGLPASAFENIPEATSIDELLQSITTLPSRLEEDLLAPIKLTLSKYERLTFLWTSWQQRALYYVPTCTITHAILQEVLDDQIGLIVTSFALPKIEECIRHNLQRVSPSSYWFLHDFFHRDGRSSRFKGVIFSEKDQRLFDDEAFWWESLQAHFRDIRSDQLFELADIFLKHPDMMIKDGDPGNEGRDNFRHIRDGLTFRAKKLRFWDPLAQKKNRNYLWLMRCPGLPLIPLDKELVSFFNTLAQHPLDLKATEDPELVSELVAVATQLQTQYNVPSITRDLSGGSSTATAIIWTDELLRDFLRALQGLLSIDRVGLKAEHCERIHGSADAGIGFSRWREGELQYVDFTLAEMTEPFHQQDIDWLAAFIKCCVFLKTKFAREELDEEEHRDEARVLSVRTKSQEERDLLSKERLARRFEDQIAHAKRREQALKRKAMRLR